MKTSFVVNFENGTKRFVVEAHDRKQAIALARRVYEAEKAAATTLACHAAALALLPR
jgi:hypothetical protein